MNRRSNQTDDRPPSARPRVDRELCRLEHRWLRQPQGDRTAQSGVSVDAFLDAYAERDVTIDRVSPGIIYPERPQSEALTQRVKPTRP